MKFNVEVKLNFKDSSIYRKIAWVEEDPILVETNKETGEVVREITLKNLDDFQASLIKHFKQLKEQGNTVEFRDHENTTYIVDMNDVLLLELSVSADTTK